MSKAKFVTELKGKDAMHKSPPPANICIVINILFYLKPFSQVLIAAEPLENIGSDYERAALLALKHILSVLESGKNEPINIYPFLDKFCHVTNTSLQEFEALDVTSIWDSVIKLITIVIPPLREVFLGRISSSLDIPGWLNLISRCFHAQFIHPAQTLEDVIRSTLLNYDGDVDDDYEDDDDDEDDDDSRRYPGTFERIRSFNAKILYRAPEILIFAVESTHLPLSLRFTDIFNKSGTKAKPPSAIRFPSSFDVSVFLREYLLPASAIGTAPPKPPSRSRKSSKDSSVGLAEVAGEADDEEADDDDEEDEEGFEPRWYDLASVVALEGASFDSAQAFYRCPAAPSSSAVVGGGSGSEDGEGQWFKGSGAHHEQVSRAEAVEHNFFAASSSSTGASASSSDARRVHPRLLIYTKRGFGSVLERLKGFVSKAGQMRSLGDATFACAETPEHYDEARHYYEEAIAYDEGLRGVLTERLQALEQIERNQIAHSYETQADLSLGRRRFKEACDLYKNAMRSAVVNSPLYLRIREKEDYMMKIISLEIANHLTEKGQECVRAGSFPQAREHFAQALKLNPNYIHLQSILSCIEHSITQQTSAQKVAEANQAMKTGKYKNANALFLEAIDLVPERRTALRPVLDSLVALMQGEEALVKQRAGLVALEDKKYATAIALITEAITLLPEESKMEHAFFLCDRAQVYFEMKDYETAISDCSEALQLRADLAIAYLRLGAAQFELSLYDEATSSYERAIRHDPSLSDQVKVKVRQVNTAKEVLQRKQREAERARQKEEEKQLLEERRAREEAAKKERAARQAQEQAEKAERQRLREEERRQRALQSKEAASVKERSKAEEKERLRRERQEREQVRQQERERIKAEKEKEKERQRRDKEEQLRNERALREAEEQRQQEFAAEMERAKQRQQEAEKEKEAEREKARLERERIIEEREKARQDKLAEAKKIKAAEKNTVPSASSQPAESATSKSAVAISSDSAAAAVEVSSTASVATGGGGSSGKSSAANNGSSVSAAMPISFKVNDGKNRVLYGSGAAGTTATSGASIAAVPVRMRSNSVGKGDASSASVSASAAAAGATGAGAPTKWSALLAPPTSSKPQGKSLPHLQQPQQKRHGGAPDPVVDFPPLRPGDEGPGGPGSGVGGAGGASSSGAAGNGKNQPGSAGKAGSGGYEASSSSSSNRSAWADHERAMLEASAAQRFAEADSSSSSSSYMKTQKHTQLQPSQTPDQQHQKPPNPPMQKTTKPPSPSPSLTPAANPALTPVSSSEAGTQNKPSSTDAVQLFAASAADEGEISPMMAKLGIKTGGSSGDLDTLENINLGAGAATQTGGSQVSGGSQGVEHGSTDVSSSSQQNDGMGTGLANLSNMQDLSPSLSANATIPLGADYRFAGGGSDIGSQGISLVQSVGSSEGGRGRVGGLALGLDTYSSLLDGSSSSSSSGAHSHLRKQQQQSMLGGSGSGESAFGGLGGLGGLGFGSSGSGLFGDSRELLGAAGVGVGASGDSTSSGSPFQGGIGGPGQQPASSGSHIGLGGLNRAYSDGLVGPGADGGAALGRFGGGGGGFGDNRNLISRGTSEGAAVGGLGLGLGISMGSQPQQDSFSSLLGYSNNSMLGSAGEQSPYLQSSGSSGLSSELGQGFGQGVGQGLGQGLGQGVRQGLGGQFLGATGLSGLPSLMQSTGGDLGSLDAPDSQSQFLGSPGLVGTSGGGGSFAQQSPQQPQPLPDLTFGGLAPFAMHGSHQPPQLPQPQPQPQPQASLSTLLDMPLTSSSPSLVASSASLGVGRSSSSSREVVPEQEFPSVAWLRQHGMHLYRWKFYSQGQGQGLICIEFAMHLPSELAAAIVGPDPQQQQQHLAEIQRRTGCRMWLETAAWEQGRQAQFLVFYRGALGSPSHQAMLSALEVVSEAARQKLQQQQQGQLGLGLGLRQQLQYTPAVQPVTPQRESFLDKVVQSVAGSDATPVSSPAVAAAAASASSAPTSGTASPPPSIPSSSSSSTPQHQPQQQRGSVVGAGSSNSSSGGSSSSSALHALAASALGALPAPSTSSSARHDRPPLLKIHALPGSGYVQRYLEIPREVVGLIIGQGGKKIKELCTESGAKIQFRVNKTAEREGRPGLLEVQGSSDNVDKGLQLIWDLLQLLGKEYNEVLQSGMGSASSKAK